MFVLNVVILWKRKSMKRLLLQKQITNALNAGKKILRKFLSKEKKLKVQILSVLIVLSADAI